MLFKLLNLLGRLLGIWILLRYRCHLSQQCRLSCLALHRLHRCSEALTKSLSWCDLDPSWSKDCTTTSTIAMKRMKAQQIVQLREQSDTESARPVRHESFSDTFRRTEQLRKPRPEIFESFANKSQRGKPEGLKRRRVGRVAKRVAKWVEGCWEQTAEKHIAARQASSRGILCGRSQVWKAFRFKCVKLRIEP